MSKHLDATAIVNELRGASRFFHPAAPEVAPKTQAAHRDDTVVPRHHDTTVSRHHDTAIPRDHAAADRTAEESPDKASLKGADAATGATVERGADAAASAAAGTASGRDPDLVEAVRKAVRAPGKEAATHRFTLAEKRAVADIVYTYRQQGVRTSENEITRIALNTLLADYRRNGANSTLACVLAKLNV